MDLKRELDTAISLARSAGRRILEHYALDIIAEEKLGVDQQYEPVTAADREASRMIVDGIQKAFPDDGILSEEEADVPDARLSRSRVWIIDPIDGTAGFVKKDGDFAVQIGLAVDGKAKVGVVLLPYHGITYYASAGGGCFREENGTARQISASRETDFSKMTMAVSRNHPSPKIQTVLESFGVGGVANRGSVGLKIGLIAERQCDLYVHLSHRTKLWDTCGPQVILEEAGGRLTDLFGEEFRYDIEDLQNHGGICATNGAVHDEVIRRLEPVLRDFQRLRYRPRSARI